jgi:hypothetical protein
MLRHFFDVGVGAYMALLWWNPYTHVKAAEGQRSAVNLQKCNITAFKM